MSNGIKKQDLKIKSIPPDERRGLVWDEKTEEWIPSYTAPTIEVEGGSSLLGKFLLDWAQRRNEPTNPWDIYYSRHKPKNKLEKMIPILQEIREYVASTAMMPRDFLEKVDAIGGQEGLSTGRIDKKKEIKNIKDWMSNWFADPHTVERGVNMGRTEKEMEDIASSLDAAEIINWRDTVDRLEQEKKDPSSTFPLGILYGDDKESYYEYNAPKLMRYTSGGVFKPGTNIAYVSPSYTLGHPKHKKEFEGQVAHELLHSAINDEGQQKLTDKERDLIRSGMYDNTTIDDPNAPFSAGQKILVEMMRNQSGAWRPYEFKHMPYFYGGKWAEQRPFRGQDRRTPSATEDPEGGRPIRRTFSGYTSKYLYYQSPEEVYARIFAVRSYLDAAPGEQINIKDLEEIKNAPAMNDLLRYMPIKHVKKLLNELAGDVSLPAPKSDVYSLSGFA